MSDVLLLTGAGQIGLAITRRVGAGKPSSSATAPWPTPRPRQTP